MPEPRPDRRTERQLGLTFLTIAGDIIVSAAAWATGAHLAAVALLAANALAAIVLGWAYLTQH